MKCQLVPWEVRSLKTFDDWSLNSSNNFLSSVSAPTKVVPWSEWRSKQWPLRTVSIALYHIQVHCVSWVTHEDRDKSFESRWAPTFRKPNFYWACIIHAMLTDNGLEGDPLVVGKLSIICEFVFEFWPATACGTFFDESFNCVLTFHEPIFKAQGIWGQLRSTVHRDQMWFPNKSSPDFIISLKKSGCPFSTVIAACLNRAPTLTNLLCRKGFNFKVGSFASSFPFLASSLKERFKHFLCRN